MSQIHIRHIRSTLEKIFVDKIDISDMSRIKPVDRELMVLSRSLAAYSLMKTANIDIQTSIDAIVDGYEDNGIDAVFFDKLNNKFYIVFSKWMQQDDKSPKLGDIQKLIKGINDLIDAKFERFNERVKRKKELILSALDNAEVKFSIIICYTGIQKISSHVKDSLDDFLRKGNTPSEFYTLTILTQDELHKFVTGGTEGDPINVDVSLFEWGQIREPYIAYYGQIEAEIIAGWYDQYGPRILKDNLRKVITDSEVNASISQTLLQEPGKFWYYNNGITVLCADIKKKPIGGSEHASGVFECSNIRVVNGAQTVGSIHMAFVQKPDCVTKAKVQIRFISLQNCPDDFGTEVTRSTNTQNRIEGRDFVSMDPQQARLKTELWLDLQKRYVYKRGEKIESNSEGCTLVEATIALACAYPDVSLAVKAKGRLGQLWENIERPPYTALFSPGLTSLRMWHYVEIMRNVDEELKKIQQSRNGRERMIAVHGNRLILHRVFLNMEKKDFDNQTLDIDQKLSYARDQARKEYLNVCKIVQKIYPDEPLHSLFKNIGKCKEIEKNIGKIKK